MAPVSIGQVADKTTGFFLPRGGGVSAATTAAPPYSQPQVPHPHPPPPQNNAGGGNNQFMSHMQTQQPPSMNNYNTTSPYSNMSTPQQQQSYHHPATYPQRPPTAPPHQQALPPNKQYHQGVPQMIQQQQQQHYAPPQRPMYSQQQPPLTYHHHQNPTTHHQQPASGPGPFMPRPPPNGWQPPPPPPQYQPPPHPAFAKHPAFFPPPYFSGGGGGGQHQQFESGESSGDDDEESGSAFEGGSETEFGDSSSFYTQDDGGSEYGDEDSEYGDDDESSATGFYGGSDSGNGRYPMPFYPPSPLQFNHYAGQRPLTPPPRPFSVNDLYHMAPAHPNPPPLQPQPQQQRPVWSGHHFIPQQPPFMQPQQQQLHPNLWFPKAAPPPPPPAAVQPQAQQQQEEANQPIQMHNGKPVVNLNLVNFNKVDTPRNIIVMAKPGQGKTSVLLTMASILRNRFSIVIVLTLSPDTVVQFNKYAMHNVLIFTEWHTDPKKNIVHLLLDAMEEQHRLREAGMNIDIPSVCLILDDVFMDEAAKKDPIWSKMMKVAHRDNITTVISCHDPVDVAKNARSGNHMVMLGEIAPNYLEQAHTSFFATVDGLGSFKAFEAVYKASIGKGRMLVVDSKSESKTFLSRMVGIDKDELLPFTLCCRDFYILMAMFGKSDQYQKQLLSKIKTLQQNPAYARAMANYVNAQTGQSMVPINAQTMQPVKQVETKLVSDDKSPFVFAIHD
jgi:hypothetical protein